MNQFIKRTLSFVMALAMVIGMLPAMETHVHAATVNILDDQLSVSDTKDTLSGDAAEMTATAEGSLENQTDNTITITNISEKTLQVSLDYSVSGASAFMIDDETADAAGFVTKQLDPDGAVTFYMLSNSGSGDLTATLTLTNISAEEVSETSDVVEESETSDVDQVSESSDVVEESDTSDLVVESAHSDLAEDIASRINAILEDYGITADMDDNTIANQIILKDSDAAYATHLEIAALEEDAQALTEEDFLFIEENADLDLYSHFLNVWEMLFTPSLATTVNVLDGQVSVADSANSNKVSNGTVTITAKGSLFSKKTNNITITNETDSTAELKFDYTVSYANSFKIAGATADASGTYSGLLDAGKTLSITLVSNNGLSNTTATLTLSNFSLTVAAESSNVTINYDASLGSVTAGGTAVNSGGTLPNINATNGVALVATQKSGAAFLGWINAADNTIISKSASYTLTPASDMTVKAVFSSASTNAWWMTDNKLYNNLAVAVGATQDKKVILASNGTLPAGEYTIPSGVTLLIPYNTANTVNKATPETVAEYVKPSAFRTLTMASGASITVNGEICVSGKQSAKQDWAGCVTGPYGCISMQSGSSITMENGSNLYAWGYIIGSGSVEAKSGSTVYEDFQLLDFRGGDGTTQMQDNEYGVFPMSQYYIQNIEVPLKLHAGALEKGYMSIEVTLVGNVGSHVPVISTTGGGAMFELSSGYIIKDYDESTGRLVFTIDDNATIAVKPITISMRVSLLGSVTINSQNYNLPIPGHMTVNAVSGNVTLGQHLALLPGAELNVAEDVFCTVGEGIRIIVYDADDWDNYCNDKNERYYDLPYVGSASGHKYPAKNATYTDAAVCVDGVIDASAGYVYTTAGGANVYSTGTGKVITVPGSDTLTHQVTQNGSDITGWPEIAITPAKLKNGDGKYFATPTSASEDGKPYGFVYENDRWVCADVVNSIDCTGHTPLEDQSVVTAPTCTEAGYTTYTCSICGHSYTGDTVAAKGHTEGTAVVENEVAATCEAAGSYDNVVYCTVCKAELSRDTVTVDKLAHTEVIDAAVAPTCTETGLTEGKHCSVCNAVIVAQKEVAALGHTEGTAVVENEVAATCEAAGSYDNVVYCTVCNAEISRNKVTVDKLPHTEVIDAAVAATCTATGLTEGKHCSVCNAVIVAQEEVAALGHTPGTAATCTDPQTCTVCGETITAALGHSWVEADCDTPKTCSVCDATEGNALGHAKIPHDAKEPTCTEVGWDAYETCSRCNYTTYVEKAALGHKWTDANCTTPKTCSVCGETEGEALGHTPSTAVTENAKPATCTETGSYDSVVYCSVCDVELSRTSATVPALGHTEGTAVVENEVAATCEAAGGYDTVVRCVTCGAEVSRVRTTIPATDHSYGEWTEITAPGCETKGQERRDCANCDHYETQEIPAKGHDMKETAAKVEATCEAAGKEAVLTCANGCGKTEGGKEIPAKGHTAGEVVVENNVDATCAEDGSYDNVTYCSVCGTELSRETVTVDATGHTEATAVIENEVKANCTVDGSYERVVYCNVCNVEMSRETILVPATGHDYNNGKCNNCGDELLTVVTVGLGAEDYSVEGKTVTVTYDKPCKVGFLNETDNKYSIIEASANENGSYSFTAPEGVTEVLIVILGNANGDERVTVSDIAALNAHLQDKKTLDNKAFFAADADNNGNLENDDITVLSNALLGKESLAWKASVED